MVARAVGGGAAVPGAGSCAGGSRAVFPAVAESGGVVAAGPFAEPGVALGSGGAGAADPLEVNGVGGDAIMDVNNFIAGSGGFFGDPGGVADLARAAVPVCGALAQALISVAVTVKCLTPVPGGAGGSWLEVVGRARQGLACRVEHHRVGEAERESVGVKFIAGKI